MTEPALLHIYGHDEPHGDIYVIGNELGLLRLRDAIEIALTRQQGLGEAEVMVSDGEEYFISVVRHNADWHAPAWQNIVLPYTAEWIVQAEREKGKQHPSTVLLYRGTRP
jgi:hypothetical protein